MKRSRVILAVSVTLVTVLAVVGHDALTHGVLPPVAEPAWAGECGSCHMAYHPALLPVRSWRALMEDLPSHFGQELSIDSATAARITAFLVTNAGDTSSHRRARSLAAGIAPGETPRRVSETNWFESRHRKLGPTVWTANAVGGRANCPACHPGAAEGDFEGRRARVPL